jgi:hypothetical protein
MAPRRKNTASTAVAGADQISGEESRPKAKQKRTRKETRTAKAKAKGKQRGAYHIALDELQRH